MEMNTLAYLATVSLLKIWHERLRMQDNGWYFEIDLRRK